MFPDLKFPETWKMMYSRVPNNRPPRLLIFEKFSNPPALIPAPPFINFWKFEMILDE